MKSPEVGGFNTEPSLELSPLDRRGVLSRLARLNQELGWGFEEDVMNDLEGDNPEDDNVFLGNLATLAMLYNISDPEEFFRLLGIELEDS